ncbi:hypothetical protein PghCCS26_37250 [Paenibacillus glycanilyticus]|uniref:Uncharacterized protein n=1 Tax=Paenibacillus glycanilyticus TaxID=126569 RepID=A0ABQ6NNB3_9BACL|nr:hypothetical protein PghCCS26_37250 [Paenibacillus glycanilyticus]
MIIKEIIEIEENSRKESPVPLFRNRKGFGSKQLEWTKRAGGDAWLFGDP